MLHESSSSKLLLVICNDEVIILLLPSELYNIQFVEQNMLCLCKFYVNVNLCFLVFEFLEVNFQTNLDVKFFRSTESNIFRLKPFHQLLSFTSHFVPLCFCDKIIAPVL